VNQGEKDFPHNWGQERNSVPPDKYGEKTVRQIPQKNEIRKKSMEIGERKRRQFNSLARVF